MRSFSLLAVLALVSTLVSADQLLIIQGSSGESIFDPRFDQAANKWLSLAEDANIPATLIKGPEGESSARQRIENWLADPAMRSAETVWIVYLGHGTFGPSGAKLNLVGPDLSAREMGQLLEVFDQTVVFIHGGSASAPFLSSVSGPKRVIVTATRSGTEQNYARFGEFFVEALRSPRSDIDLDGRVSLLEAFISASNSVETFYSEANRLTTEHALIDDNGDAKGSPVSAFNGLRARNRSDESDGRLARKLSLQPASGDHLLTLEQIKERDLLEARLDALHTQKKDLSEEEYYTSLESILTELSKLYLGAESDS